MKATGTARAEGRRVIAMALSGGVLLLAGPLAGCARHAVGGQTLARVNGEPVTRDDVALEQSLLGPGSAMTPAAILQALIDRKLLAQDARARGEDYASEFVRLERRWRESALAARDAQIIAARARVGTSAAGTTPQAMAAQQAVALTRHRAALRAGADIVVLGGAGAAMGR